MPLVDSRQRSRPSGLGLLGRFPGGNRTEMRQLQSLQRARQALESHSELMGSCRQLRNILLSSSAANYFGAILVTGLRGSSEELATTCGLAKAMAEVSTAGVLLVDADCQHPVLHDLFDVPLSPGLSDLADDQRELAGVVRPISDRLALLTNGSDGDRASRLLSVDPRVRWFGEARDRYDFIVLNAPALLSSLTATAAAALAGNVVLMVEAERDDELSARKARGLLNQVGARILGLALVDSRKF